MADTLSYPEVSEVKLFLGATYTGKSERLLLEIVDLLSRGVTRSDLLVFCATPDAAQSLRARLARHYSEVEQIEITTPRAFLLNLLDSEAAYTITGRKARLLLPFEYDFFLEDLKTSGIRPNRLRELLKFLYRSLSELADDDEDWLLTNEEQGLYRLMRECLAFTGAILEPELANVAVRYLRSSSRARSAAARRFVFVDDFQLLSRASQVASCLLAKERLFAAANPDAVQEVFESYPYGAGVDELIHANPRATQILLASNYSCKSARKASHALYRKQSSEVLDLRDCANLTNYNIKHSLPLAQDDRRRKDVPILTKDSAVQEVNLLAVESEDPEDNLEVIVCEDFEDGLVVIKNEDPEAELVAVADAVEQAVQHGVLPQDIVIAAPHTVWMRSLHHLLTARGLLVSLLPDTRTFRGDIRNNSKNYLLRFITLLSLVASPTDAVAWRCWCGFGDSLANSSGIRSLRTIGHRQGSTLDVVLDTDALQAVMRDGRDAALGIARITQARDEARMLIAQLANLRGQALLEAVAQQLAGTDARVPEKLQDLLLDDEHNTKTLSAQQMVSRVRTQVGFPQYSRTDALRIAAYERIVGQSPRYLFLTGFLNGFYPQQDYFDGTVLTIEQQEKRHARDLSVLANLIAKAGDTLVVSLCKKLDLEAATRLNLVVNRIVHEEGKCIARTEPSIFMEYLLT